MTDPIADMLNRIRNAQAVFSETVSIPYSKIKYEIASIMQREGFVKDVEKKGRKEKRIIKITFKKDLKVSGLRRVSKLGQRLYISCKDIKPVKGGYGIAVISTSKGLMSNKEARKNKLGGEIICEIW
ncbi:30S ribosomal protein S8 [Parcubacteria bacterium DG_72]|nr:MAG: 30S ribosomal protein S8 [Parcubacteria bacterium DG_72]